MLIVDSFAVIGLLAWARGRMPARSRPVLGLTALSFFVGLLLATASNEQVARLAGAPVLAFHALWHLVSAFGFLVMFLFNHLRFDAAEATGSIPP